MSNKKVVTACILVVLCSFYVFSATDKSGIITKNESWNVENSPYIISDDLLIAENARVTITPGVEILIGKPVSFIAGIPQADRLDSFAISIKVQGALKCVGRADNRIVFSLQYGTSEQCQWYGLVLNTERSSETEIAYTDIASACNAITVAQGSPLIRNTILEYNNVGIACTGESSPKICNCIIANNFTAGILIQKANPSILNNIIAYNKTNGIWSDNLSRVTIEYNCIFGNTDANLSGCNPELGINKKKNKNRDSTDIANNLICDPVFAGSRADSVAVEQDISLQTDKSRVKDTTLARAFNETLTDSTAIKWISRNYKRYTLSTYSPCINAGKPGKQFNDMDGSRNDIGVRGGQEFVDFSK